MEEERERERKKPRKTNDPTIKDANDLTSNFSSVKSEKKSRE